MWWWNLRLGVHETILPYLTSLHLVILQGLSLGSWRYSFISKSLSTSCRIFPSARKHFLTSEYACVQRLRLKKRDTMVLTISAIRISKWSCDVTNSHCFQNNSLKSNRPFRAYFSRKRMAFPFPLFKQRDRVRLTWIVKLIAEHFMPKPIVPWLFNEVSVYLKAHPS